MVRKKDAHGSRTGEESYEAAQLSEQEKMRWTTALAACLHQAGGSFFQGHRCRGKPKFKLSSKADVDLCPMILVSFIVTALTVLETIPPLQWACMLAFLLKLFWLRLCVGLARLIIFLALSPLVFLSGLSEFLCPTFSIHHLIIYRQPGHTDREKLDYDPFVARMCQELGFDCHEDEDSEDGLLTNVMTPNVLHEDSESSVSSV
ncbi:hypothetical protein AK812_SmicGene31509 [Symbiodinium microadriaticum]|uniref:Uncharacterized protein n=1 Tax=Symbiodinium microadriaticum TaxID=2951 RepID=A0A1Q9CWH0_SYMMI|nr:hypothetical protein AK812_SmicGene31509 [Symbiodinium microadriaticum]